MGLVRPHPACRWLDGRRAPTGAAIRSDVLRWFAAWPSPFMGPDWWGAVGAAPEGWRGSVLMLGGHRRSTTRDTISTTRIRNRNAGSFGVPATGTHYGFLCEDRVSASSRPAYVNQRACRTRRSCQGRMPHPDSAHQVIFYRMFKL
ncbi:hypothetical protein GFGA_1d1135 [Gluconobacter frateurii NBRC 103465]|nr:hypothetical protein GFGA_1d1135 [Gluconobacter frateurii NBRC 103465]